MERLEREASDSFLRISIKYPDGVNQKWSEDTADVRCKNCGSVEVTSDISGDLLMLACLECVNHTTTHINSVFRYTEDERAFIKLPNGFEEQ